MLRFATICLLCFTRHGGSTEGSKPVVFLRTSLEGERFLTERIYRDSVHNIIRVNTDSDEGKLVIGLIDSREFQRLRRIRQLGLAYFAYQGAEHSRFTHSLGAFHLAARMIAKLRTGYHIPEEAQTAVRVAALLHDIGHG